MAEVKLARVEEHPFGITWQIDEPGARTSHALRVDGRVWIVDPVEHPAALERIEVLGPVAGVLQLIDRHNRDCAAIAGRLGVPHLRVPSEVPGTPLEVVRVVDNRRWREVALWWPEEKVLLCGDALGTVGYFVARGELLGVHPLLRLVPPRALSRFAPRHVLCGHGDGVHGEEAAPALAEALATARRRLPSVWRYGWRQAKGGR